MRLGFNYINTQITHADLPVEKQLKEVQEFCTLLRKQSGIKLKVRDYNTAQRLMQSIAPPYSYYGTDEFGYIGFWEDQPIDYADLEYYENLL